MKKCLVCDVDVARERTYCLRCLPAVHFVQIQVRTAMQRAKLKPVQLLKCEDCQGGAQCYDHRYYARPFEVAPVCVTCNRIRGPALDVRDLARKALGLDGGAPAFKVRAKRAETPIKAYIDLVGILNHEEHKEIVTALCKTGYNKTSAAKLLGISFRSLRYRLARLHIDC